MGSSQILDTSSLGSNPISATYPLCEKVQVASHHSASTFLGCKTGMMMITILEPSSLVVAIDLHVWSSQNIARPTCDEAQEV